MSNPCPKCQREFSTARGVISHMESCVGTAGVLHGVRRWESSRNQQLFTREDVSDPDEFIATEDAYNSRLRRYVCPMCNKNFGTVNCLQNHFDTGIHDTSKNFECKECGKHFKRMSHLRSHQQMKCTSFERLGDLMVDNMKNATRLMITNNVDWSDSPEATLYFDGGSRGNPGKSFGGYVIHDHRGRETKRATVYLPYRATSNQAEYAGLINGLKAAAKLRICDLKICGDSELVIKQMNGEYRVNNAHLIMMNNQAQRCLSEFRQTKLLWIRREDNSVADSIVKRGLFEDTYDEVLDEY